MGPSRTPLHKLATLLGFISLATGQADLTWGQVRGAHITVSPHAGTSSWGEDFRLESRLLYGVRLGFMPFPAIGVEGTWAGTETKTDGSPSFDVHVEHVGFDVHVNLRPRHRLNPYLAGGWAELSYDGEPADSAVGGRELFMNGWEAGGGIQYLLGQRDGFRADLRFDVRDVLTEPSVWLKGADSDDHSLLVSLGVHLAFSARAKTDEDGDGVADAADECPDTPRGTVVDVAGCPLDSDDDGVVDGLDRCANTPAGVAVDASGCPIDFDRDGVADSLDECPSTPVGALIDAKGCPKDFDGDGVFDGLDLCANTPAGREVNEKGCPTEASPIERELAETGMIRTSEIHFETGSAEIDRASRSILEEIGRTLIQYPDARIEISGHTDSQGSEADNLSLSARRAQAVLAHLRSLFIEVRPERYSVQGYGESQPVAPNDSAEGRAKNRRVEFKILNREVLER
jgi:outer membrane protein OmpA-like peptidoglycan-associated protein